MLNRLARIVTLMVFAVSAGGCARSRILEELRRDERLHRQQSLLTRQIAELKQRNEELAYEVDYLTRRHDVGRRETEWWKTYGREDLGQCIDAVHGLLGQVDGRLQGLYSTYYGAACRKRNQIERTSSVLVADLGHAFDRTIEITSGLTYIAEPTRFSFAVLRPVKHTTGGHLYRVVWTTPQISTVGGEEQRWHFLQSFTAKKGDIPAIVFPGPAGIYMDQLEVTSGSGIGLVSLLPQRAVPEKDTLLALPQPVRNRQYSFALLGVPSTG